MRDIEILNEHPRKVLDKLKLGQVDSIEYGVEQITDDFMIYGLRGGLIDELSKSFPDPRKECEITAKQILCASIAGHFQDMYAITKLTLTGKRMIQTYQLRLLVVGDPTSQAVEGWSMGYG